MPPPRIRPFGAPDQRPNSAVVFTQPGPTVAGHGGQEPAFRRADKDWIGAAIDRVRKAVAWQESTYSVMDSVASLCGCYKFSRGKAALHIVSHSRGHESAHVSARKIVGGLYMGYAGAALRFFVCWHLDHQKG